MKKSNYDSHRMKHKYSYNIACSIITTCTILVVCTLFLYNSLKTDVKDDASTSTLEPTYLDNSLLESLIDAPEEFYITGYVIAPVNIRKEPNEDGEILDVIPTGATVRYINVTENFSQIQYDGSIAYICSDYIRQGALDYKSISVHSRGFKSYMSYTAITNKNSKQYEIQQNYAYTGTYGIRQVDKRFCIALGSAAGSKMGSYVDLVLENGTIIYCVLADQKADIHTLSDNLTTAYNGCVSEFIVDSNSLVSTAKKMGDVSYVDYSWNSPVKEIRVYNVGIFEPLFIIDTTAEMED